MDDTCRRNELARHAGVTFWGATAFGTYVRALRLAAGLSLEVAAATLAHLGCAATPADLTAWEDGLQMPSALERAALVDVLAGDPARADALLLADAAAAPAIAQALDAGDFARIEQLARQQVTLGLVAAGSGQRGDEATVRAGEADREGL